MPIPVMATVDNGAASSFKDRFRGRMAVVTRHGSIEKREDSARAPVGRRTPTMSPATTAGTTKSGYASSLPSRPPSQNILASPSVSTLASHSSSNARSSSEPPNAYAASSYGAGNANSGQRGRPVHEQVRRVGSVGRKPTVQDLMNAENGIQKVQEPEKSVEPPSQHYQSTSSAGSSMFVPGSIGRPSRNSPGSRRSAPSGTHVIAHGRRKGQVTAVSSPGSVGSRSGPSYPLSDRASTGRVGGYRTRSRSPQYSAKSVRSEPAYSYKRSARRAINLDDSMESKGSSRFSDDEVPEEQKLFFSRRPRAVGFKPYTQDDYDKLKPKSGKYVEYGGLGPDLDNEELIKKRVQRNQAMEYARRVQASNTERIRAKPRSTSQPAPDNDREKAAAARQRALEYASTSIPKPRVRPRQSSAPAAQEIAATTVDDFSGLEAPEPEMSKLEELEHRHRQHAARLDAIRRELKR